MTVAIIADQWMHFKLCAPSLADWANISCTKLAIRYIIIIKCKGNIIECTNEIESYLSQNSKNGALTFIIFYMPVIFT